MAKYHVKKDGTPGICKARLVHCPLGSENKHFSTIEDAQEYADKINENSIKNKEYFNNLNKKDFNKEQWDEIREGIKNKVDISIYANPKFNANQMYSYKGRFR